MRRVIRKQIYRLFGTLSLHPPEQGQQIDLIPSPAQSAQQASPNPVQIFPSEQALFPVYTKQTTEGFNFNPFK